MAHRDRTPRANHLSNFCVGQAVLASELTEPRVEIEHATTEPTDLRPPVTFHPLVLGEGHRDDEFPHEFSGNLGGSERMGNKALAELFRMSCPTEDEGRYPVRLRCTAGQTPGARAARVGRLSPAPSLRFSSKASSSRRLVCSPLRVRHTWPPNFRG